MADNGNFSEQGSASEKNQMNFLLAENRTFARHFYRTKI